MAHGQAKRCLRDGSQEIPQGGAHPETRQHPESYGLPLYSRSLSQPGIGSVMQRIVVAGAFAVNHDILLMDEPYGQLDVKLRFYLEGDLIKLWQTDKRTALFVTNNIDEAIIQGDRIVTMTNNLPGRMGPVYNVNIERPREPTDMRVLKMRFEITQTSKLIL